MTTLQMVTTALGVSGVEDHVCAAVDGRLFCQCGKLVDKAGLRKVRFAGFLGAQSTSDSIQKFWASGDPSVFAKPGAEDFKG